jgi:hypothetical protein
MNVPSSLLVRPRFNFLLGFCFGMTIGFLLAIAQSYLNDTRQSMYQATR